MSGAGLVKKLAWDLTGYSDCLHPTFFELLTVLLSVDLIREELASIFGEMRLDLLADHLIAYLLRKVCSDSIDVGLIIFISIDPST